MAVRKTLKTWSVLFTCSILLISPWQGTSGIILYPLSLPGSTIEKICSKIPVRSIAGALLSLFCVIQDHSGIPPGACSCRSLHNLRFLTWRHGLSEGQQKPVTLQNENYHVISLNFVRLYEVLGKRSVVAPGYLTNVGLPKNLRFHNSHMRILLMLFYAR